MAKRCELSEKHRHSLKVSLGHAGVHGDEAKACIQRLAAIARKAHQRINHLQPDVAICRMDVAWSRLRLALALYYQFECYDDHLDCLFARALGEEIGAKRDRLSAGRDQMAQLSWDLRAICLCAEKSYHGAISQLWNSRKKQDRAVRRFARAVLQEWRKTTRRKMTPPSANGLCSDKEFEAIEKEHPLVVLLEVAGIHIDIAFCIRRLMSCASGEPLVSFE